MFELSQFPRLSNEYVILLLKRQHRRHSFHIDIVKIRFNDLWTNCWLTTLFCPDLIEFTISYKLCQLSSDNVSIVLFFLNITNPNSITWMRYCCLFVCCWSISDICWITLVCIISLNVVVIVLFSCLNMFWFDFL